MATQSTLTIFADADHTVRVDVVTVDGGSTPQAMTGWALAFTIRETKATGSLVVSKTTVSGITIGNGSGTDDRATIAIADTDTTGWPAGRHYVWGLWRTDAGSGIPLAYGPCTITEASDQV